MRTVVALMLVAFQGTLQAQEHPQPVATSELARSVEALQRGASLQIGSRRVAPDDLTLALYARTGSRPVWTDDRAIVDLERAIADVRRDGLDPEHYHFSVLTGRTRAAGSPSAAELDLLRTDALVRLSRDLRFGRVEPDGPSDGAMATWMFGGDGGAQHFLDVVGSGRIRDAVDSLRPRHFVYQGLVGALTDLRYIQGAGGWPRLPAGPTMGLGRFDDRVPELRRRLGLPEDPSIPGEEPSLRFDERLEAAVRTFQHRHGLNEDGLVGEITRAALNVPVERRIDQVRVNLERARWMADALPDTFVVVNVAGAKVYLLQGDSVAFETRGIVGTEFTQTPVFAATMTYIDLNPTWTVPSGIVGEVLDRVRTDPDYLTKQDMRVLDGSGAPVDPAGIDFSSYTASSFPYVFRQDPGPLNALGRIKLMFPNAYSVYLHDTPTRGLFAEEERLFSHGCIRVQDPLSLAERVIGDTEAWNVETLEAAIASGETRTIDLATPVPVLVLYWTASADLHGDLHFYGDPYGRDEAVLTGLDTDPGQGTVAPRRR